METQAAVDPAPAEGSIRGSVVALLTPIIAVVASGIAGVVAEIMPGAELDPAQVTALMVAVVTTVLGVALKWLHGWQGHELRVSTGAAAPVKQPVTARSTRPAKRRKAA